MGGLSGNELPYSEYTFHVLKQEVDCMLLMVQLVWDSVLFTLNRIVVAELIVFAVNFDE